MLQVNYPIDSLAAGRWFKLICGASYQHLPEIRNLALVFTLAGADCIDVAADPAVIYASQSGIQAALALQGKIHTLSPLRMVSLNDGEDPHFRKASFDPAICPPDCPQPCQSICPAEAIRFDIDTPGVLAERCYGCGRCLPICPIQQIQTKTHPATLDAVLPFIANRQITALEIHTQVGRSEAFSQLWQLLAPYQHHLQVLSISCPDDPDLLAYLGELAQIIQPLSPALIWQTDGRPMSGDIGDGATRATVKLGQKVLESGLPGYVQLAGGTNNHTVTKLKQLGLLKPSSPISGPTRYITGVAYGSYARSLLIPVQNALADRSSQRHLEDHADLLNWALDLAKPLVTQIKTDLKC